MGRQLKRVRLPLAALLALTVLAAPARATAPRDALTAPPSPAAMAALTASAVGPDPLGTTLECKPTNGLTTRAGDDVNCRLVVLFTAGWGYDVTADITVPALTSFDPSVDANQYGHP